MRAYPITHEKREARSFFRREDAHNNRLEGRLGGPGRRKQVAAMRVQPKRVSMVGMDGFEKKVGVTPAISLGVCLQCEAKSFYLVGIGD